MGRKKIIRIRRGEIEIKDLSMDLDNFLESMRVAAQRYFGIPDEKKIKKWARRMLLPVGYEECFSRKRKKRR